MTPDRLQRALIDLGWITLIHRVLGGKPSASYALYQLMCSAGRVVTYGAFASAYAEFHRAGGAMAHRGGEQKGELDDSSKLAIHKRVERVRSALADLGVTGAIRTVPAIGYTMDLAGRARVEVVLLSACGIELEAAA